MDGVIIIHGYFCPNMFIKITIPNAFKEMFQMLPVYPEVFSIEG